MSLEQYKAKRRFKITPEPEPELKTSIKNRIFVVQKHAAKNLHYDLRLEADGVLKSWAIPKGPSSNPQIRRLAIMTEDHPYDYKDFEGVIPAGEYGAGQVIVWDEGNYSLWPASDQPDKEFLKGLKNGHITFVLNGKKLKGEYALIRTKANENNWLMVKKTDEYADRPIKNELSVKSRKKVEEITADDLDLSGALKAPILRNVKPMLASLIESPFDNNDWGFEIKWDGYRAIGSWDNKKVELYSRNGQSFIDKYPAIADEIKKLNHQVVIDGEIVALNEQGISMFEWLQNYQKYPQGRLILKAFDLLWVDGFDITGLPLIKRKQLLKKVLARGELISYSDDIIGQGVSFFKLSKDRQLEGIMAKRLDSVYVPGIRSKSWLKIKTVNRQEAVIGGFTEPRGSRQSLGALILGVYRGQKLSFVGHTGTGIDPSQLKPLRQRLEKIEQKNSPFAEVVKPNSAVHWVQPNLVAEVKYRELTSGGHFRQPVFVGLREDKNPKEVTLEVPKETGKGLKPKSQSTGQKDTKRLKFSHLNKVFFPESGYTKGDLAYYYQTVAETILPYLKDRPQSLLRQPNGIYKESFFQKNLPKTPQWIRTEKIWSKGNNDYINYLICDSEESLLYMIQLGCIEINPWNSRIGHLDKPDWIVLDLDPEAVGFDKVVKVALTIKDLLDNLKVPSFPKTSGKTGMHIYIPLKAKYKDEQARQFAELLANLVNNLLPDIASVLRSPKKRQGKVYVDFLQNRAGQTLAAPYSVRPTPLATVSAPLDWSEINTQLKPQNFTIKNMPLRIKDVGDLWQPLLHESVDIESVLGKI